MAGSFREPAIFSLTSAKIMVYFILIKKTVDAGITAMTPVQRTHGAASWVRNALSNGPLRAQGNVQTSILRREGIRQLPEACQSFKSARLGREARWHRGLYDSSLTEPVLSGIFYLRRVFYVSFGQTMANAAINCTANVLYLFVGNAFMRSEGQLQICRYVPVERISPLPTVSFVPANRSRHILEVTP